MHGRVGRQVPDRLALPALLRLDQVLDPVRVLTQLRADRRHGLELEVDDRVAVEVLDGTEYAGEPARVVRFET
jgi:hypothetical protein